MTTPSARETVRFVQTGEIPPILHLTLFHPTDDHYGLSPMEAAAVPLDLHNAAGAWNKALLDNAARPSGALVFASGAAGAAMSEVQFARLKEEIEKNYQGAMNAGRPLLLEGGLDWKPLSLTPKDMDFVEAKNAAARDIALAFGVPPLLLGLAGDNTHANYAEANRAFYRQTVIPLVRRTSEAIVQWLQPAYGGDRGSGPGQGLAFDPDLDAIEALAAERESLWRRVAGGRLPHRRREARGGGVWPLTSPRRGEARRNPLPLAGRGRGGGRWAGALTEPRNQASMKRAMLPSRARRPRPPPRSRFAELTLPARGRGNVNLDAVTDTIIARGDLAHLALFLWACGASALVVSVLRDLARSNQRFDDFVRELARFNRRHSEEDR